MIRSPQARFQDNKTARAAHAELCNNPAFLEALDAAVLQYHHDLPSAKDAHTSVTNSAKVEGVGEFVKVLLTLADVAPARPARVSSNLPDNVRNG